MAKIKIKKNDIVEVITGEYKGKRGKVLGVVRNKGKVIVEGVNIRKKHKKPTQKQPGGIVEIPSPIDISNVVLICPKCGDRTRVVMKKINNIRTRVCKKCQEVIE